MQFSGYERLTNSLYCRHLAIKSYTHYDADMSTTLTLDDDVADALVKPGQDLAMS